MKVVAREEWGGHMHEGSGARPGAQRRASKPEIARRKRTWFAAWRLLGVRGWRQREGCAHMRVWVWGPVRGVVRCTWGLWGVKAQ